jgi:hypothetical protein
MTSGTIAALAGTLETVAEATLTAADTPARQAER